MPEKCKKNKVLEESNNRKGNYQYIFRMKYFSFNMPIELLKSEKEDAV